MNVEYAKVPCPDPDCKDGIIVVCNAYSDNPLDGERQFCDVCGGTGEVLRQISPVNR